MKVEIDAGALRDVLGRGLELGPEVQQQLVAILADHVVTWQLLLKGPSISAPGEGIWPVGNIMGLGTRRERYLEAGDPRGRDSGRSLAGWDVELDGLNVKATNTAVDARRNFYAEFVHFSGDAEGAAVDDAWELFRDELERKAAREMGDAIEAALGRAG